jgi:micrococcal nuclease
MEASKRDDFYMRSFGIRPDRLRQVARQAKRYLIDTIKGEYVVLELGATEKDKYGRYLAYVYQTDGSMLNRSLLEKGYASVYRRFAFSHKTEFLNDEKRARDTAEGLWEKYK